MKTQKIDQGQYSAILTEAWLYYILKKTFPSGPTQEIPSRPDEPAVVANQNAD